MYKCVYEYVSIRTFRRSNMASPIHFTLFNAKTQTFMLNMFFYISNDVNSDMAKHHYYNREMDRLVLGSITDQRIHLNWRIRQRERKREMV